MLPSEARTPPQSQHRWRAPAASQLRQNRTAIVQSAPTAFWNFAPSPKFPSHSPHSRVLEELGTRGGRDDFLWLPTVSSYIGSHFGCSPRRKHSIHRLLTRLLDLAHASASRFHCS